MNSWREPLDELLGGRWAISVRGSLLALPFIVLAAPLGNSQGEANYPFLKWTLISALSVIPPVALFFVLHLTIYKNRSFRPLPWWLLLIVGAFLGTVKGFLLSYIGYKSGLVTGSLGLDIKRRVLNNLVLGVTFLPITTFVVAGYERYKIQRNKLLRQALSQHAASSHLTVSQDRVNKRTSAKLERDLAETRSVLDVLTSPGRKIDGHQIADYLRKQTSTAIRPLSHSLFNAPGEGIGSRLVRGGIKWGIFNLNIFPEAVLLVYALTSLVTFYKNENLLGGSSRLAIHVALLAATLFLMNLIITRLKIQILILKILAISALIVIYEFVVNYSIRTVDLQEDLASSQVSEGIWILFLILFASTTISVFTREEAVIESLKSIITDEELRAAEVKVAQSGASRNLASYLHTSMQTSMLNSANIIEKAAEQGDDDAIRRETEKLQTLLYLPLDLDLKADSETIDQAIQKAKRNWDGLMKVRSRLTGTSKDSSAEEIKKVSLVLDEALSNAFRHGKAKTAEIGIQCTSSELRISVTDDGLGPMKGAEGMGSQTFDSIGGADWELTSGVEKGSRFVLTIQRNKQ